MTNVSVSLKDDNAQRLDALAALVDRPRSWLINRAVEQYLAHQDWMDVQTTEAIKAVDAGAELLSHDDVMQRMLDRQQARSE